MEPIKVFITEDESIVREGLRDMIPWEQYGFVFAGEASDGEMALPMVRRIKPDILITDIKMPFMDGLAFSRFVSRELPKTKIIILSGYDDFEYAQKAIELHVDQYLLKPITRSAMIQALELTKKHIEEEQEQQDYLERFNRESQEYERYARRNFFEKLVQGSLSVPEIFEQAARYEIDLDAESYNIVLFSLQSQEDANGYSEQIALLQDRLIQDLIQYPDFLVFRSSVLNIAVLIKGTSGRIEERTQQCVRVIRDRCSESGFPLEWYAASGRPVSRLSGLPQCYASAGHAMAFRHLSPKKHVFTPDMVARETEPDSYNAADSGAADPMLLRRFIQKGVKSEIDDFVSEYFGTLGSATDSLMFRHFILLSARINALAAIEEMGFDRQRLSRLLPAPEPDATAGLDLRAYVTEVLLTALTLRDEESMKQSSWLVESALSYINSHFADEDISLNAVARSINVSANYLSAVFSQKMGMSFVEYVTQKRMARAKQLLRQSRKRTGEIASEVGYKDPRYFSFVFKKTQGCSPREYRGGDTDR